MTNVIAKYVFAFGEAYGVIVRAASESAFLCVEQLPHAGLEKIIRAIVIIHREYGSYARGSGLIEIVRENHLVDLLFIIQSIAHGIERPDFRLGWAH